LSDRDEAKKDGSMVVAVSLSKHGSPIVASSRIWLIGDSSFFALQSSKTATNSHETGL